MIIGPKLDRVNRPLEFMKNCTEMLSKFTQRGYPIIVTQQAYHKTFPLQRNNLNEEKITNNTSRRH